MSMPLHFTGVRLYISAVPQKRSGQGGVCILPSGRCPSTDRAHACLRCCWRT